MTHVETVTPPPTTPVTLSEVKSHLRIAGTLEDGLLAAYLQAAVRLTEDYTGRRWIHQTVRQTTGTPYDVGVVELLRSPVLSVASVEGARDDGSWMALSNAYVLHGSRIRFLAPLPRLPAVRIAYDVGYHQLPPAPSEAELQQAREAVPAPVRTAILQLTGHLYEHREGQAYEPRYASRAASYESASLPPMVLDMIRPFVLWGA